MINRGALNNSPKGGNKLKFQVVVGETSGSRIHKQHMLVSRDIILLGAQAPNIIVLVLVVTVAAAAAVGGALNTTPLLLLVVSQRRRNSRVAAAAQSRLLCIPFVECC